MSTFGNYAKMGSFCQLHVCRFGTHKVDTCISNFDIGIDLVTAFTSNKKPAYWS